MRQFLYFFFRLIFRNKAESIPIDISKINRILIIRYDKIGDMIATLPSIDLIKKLKPSIQVDILCSYQNYQVIKNDTRIDNIYKTESSKFKILINSLKLRKNKYDLLFSFVFYKTTFGGLISNLAGNNRTIKVTIEHKDRKNLYSAFFNLMVPSEDFIMSKNMVEVLNHIVCYTFGIDYSRENICQKIYLDDISLNRARKFIELLPKGNYIIMNLSAGHPIRQWSEANNKILIEKLAGEYPDFIFILISSPQDYPSSLSISSFFPDRVFSYNSRSILDVAALIPYARIVITPDTSIVHLSSVYSIPVLVLYSRYSTNINNWQPFNTPNRIVLTQKKESLNTILPEEVFFAFKSFYSGLNPSI